MSVILRTAGIDRTAEELAWDLENLLTVWTAILNVVLERPSPFLIYRESDSVVRALRDYLTGEIGEILIDDETTYNDAREFVEQVMPQNLKKLKHYVDPVPLFTRFQIETQIESAFGHSVNLPSGGSIVIDHTEAMVSIDVNSARATKGGDIEATALNTNLEAADEVARQLRIRDLGGLVVIDFIDMGPQKAQREVENRLRAAVRQDRARVQIGKISRFGLLEMSRQRLRPSIGESAYQTCPRCTGFGTIRSVESLALAILRIIGEEVRKERTAKVIAMLPVEVATYLLNEKRDWVQTLESRHDTQVVLVANSALETPHYEVRRVRDDQTELAENAGVSYALSHAAVEPESPQAILERKAIEQPVVGTMKPTTAAPKPQKPKEPAGKGFWATIMGLFSGGEEEKKTQRQRDGGGQGGRGRRTQQTRRRGSSDSRKTSDKRGPQRKKAAKKTATKKAATKKRPAKKTASKKAPAKKQVADDKQKTPADAQAQNVATEESGAEPKRSSRNRRSRGGRRRRRTADKPEQTADGQQAATESASQQPKTDNNKADNKDTKPAEQAPAPQKPKQDAGPPRVRTDDERAQDTKKREDSAPKPAPKSEAVSAPEPAPKAESAKAPEQAPAPKPKPKPAGDGNGASAKPAGRLLPWEPQAAADVKPPPKSAEPKPAPKPEPAAVAPQKPEPAAAPPPRPEPAAAPPPKPDSKPAEPAQD
jgi:ribonuclease E